MRIFTDGAFAHPEKIGDKWKWVIDEFVADACTYRDGTDEEVFACVSSDTERDLTSEGSYYCDNCDREISYEEYSENEGLCDVCIDAMQ